MKGKISVAAERDLSKRCYEDLEGLMGPWSGKN